MKMLTVVSVIILLLFGCSTAKEHLVELAPPVLKVEKERVIKSKLASPVKEQLIFSIDMLIKYIEEYRRKYEQTSEESK